MNNFLKKKKEEIPLTPEEQKEALIGKGIEFTNGKTWKLEKGFTKKYLKDLIKGR